MGSKKTESYERIPDPVRSEQANVSQSKEKYAANKPPELPPRNKI